MENDPKFCESNSGEVKHQISTQENSFSFAADKNWRQRDFKQAAIESNYSKSLAKNLRGGNPAFGDIHVFQTKKITDSKEFHR